MRKYYPKYLDAEVYKRVVSVARSYDNDKRCIKAIEYDAIHSSPARNGKDSGGVSKPVEQIVERIDKHTRVLCGRTEAVERTLRKFPEHEQEFIRRNLLSGVPMIYCGMRDNERALKSIRHDFLILLAEELGEIL